MSYVIDSLIHLKGVSRVTLKGGGGESTFKLMIYRFPRGATFLTAPTLKPPWLLDVFAFVRLKKYTNQLILESFIHLKGVERAVYINNSNTSKLLKCVPNWVSICFSGSENSQKNKFLTFLVLFRGFFWQNYGGLGGRSTFFALFIPKLLIEEKKTTLKTKIIVKTGKNTNFSIFFKRSNFLIYWPIFKIQTFK